MRQSSSGVTQGLKPKIAATSLPPTVFVFDIPFGTVHPAFQPALAAHAFRVTEQFRICHQ